MNGNGSVSTLQNEKVLHLQTFEWKWLPHHDIYALLLSIKHVTISHFTGMDWNYCLFSTSERTEMYNI